MSKERYNAHHETDLTPSRELVERYRATIDDDDSDDSLTVVTYRGGSEEFALGCEYCASTDAGDRRTGAYILGQLGWSDRTFLEESVRILIPLLEDADDDVVYSAASALGHRADPSAIPALIRMAGHANSLVRFGVVMGLSGHEDPRAVDTLIILATDEDAAVRDWAVFGLGSQIEMDTPDIRAALIRALSDADSDARGEALVGLANRRDTAVVPALLKEWQDGEASLLSIEAAEVAADPRLSERLEQLSQTLPLEDRNYFATALENAIKACTPQV
jgi:HEAT repeat protein